MSLPLALECRGHDPCPVPMTLGKQSLPPPFPTLHLQEPGPLSVAFPTSQCDLSRDGHVTHGWGQELGSELMLNFGREFFIHGEMTCHKVNGTWGLAP